METQDKTQQIIKEYENAMRKYNEERRLNEIESRIQVIKTLSAAELKLVAELYMPELLSIQKQQTSKQNIEKEM